MSTEIPRSDWTKPMEPCMDFDEDRMVFRAVPCVGCGMGPQMGNTGFCSQECEDDLYTYYESEADG